MESLITWCAVPTGNGTKRRIAFLDMVQADVETEIYDKLWAGQLVDGVGAPNRR